MNLGEKILKLRKQHNFSQDTLASQLSVSRQSISKWELGESIPDTENIIQISKLFNVSIDYLLNEEFFDEQNLSIVKEIKTTIHTKYSKKNYRIGVVLLTIGVLGLFVLMILSSVIPANRLIQNVEIMCDNIESIFTTGSNISTIDFEEFEGSPWYCENPTPMFWITSHRVRGHLSSFLQTYHLTWLFYFLLSFIGVGFYLLLSSKMSIKRHKKINH